MASTAGTIYSGIAQANALKAQMEVQKQVSEMNQRVADYKAKDAIERGKEDEVQYRKQVKRVIGAQRAALGASGIEIGSGSALDLQTDAAAIGEADALTIRQNARMEAFGYKMEGLGIASQGKINQAALGGQLAATRGATILTGIAGAAEMGFSSGMFSSAPKLTATTPGGGGGNSKFTDTKTIY
jgi:hypothetical protein